MTLNLAAPPDFHGFHPDKPLRIYLRNLPHWRQPGATYFVTFNLADALPRQKRNQLTSMRRDWEKRFPPPRDEQAWNQYAKTVFCQVEKWMDAGYGACWLRQPKYAHKLREAILHFHEQRYGVGCFVIMANHCHLVIRPFENFELEAEVGSIKSVSANFLNKHEKRTGPLWQQESYDRIIRDEEHLYRVVQYIGANPRKAAVPSSSWNRWINPDRQSKGWHFHDLK